MPRKNASRTGRPPLGSAKKKSTSVYLLFGSGGVRKCTSVYFEPETDEAYSFLKNRPGGFSLSHFVNYALQEEAKAWGWQSEDHEALQHLKKRRGGFILSAFINSALQDHAKAAGWIPGQVI